MRVPTLLIQAALLLLQTSLQRLLRLREEPVRSTPNTASPPSPRRTIHQRLTRRQDLLLVRHEDGRHDHGGGVGTEHSGRQLQQLLVHVRYTSRPTDAATTGPQVHIGHQEVRRPHVLDGDVTQQVDGEVAEEALASLDHVEDHAVVGRESARGHGAEEGGKVRLLHVDGGYERSRHHSEPLMSP